jgi:hypothetical protein
VYGFEKSTKSNVDASEKKALKLMARELGALSDEQIERSVASGEFVEIGGEEDEDENDEA